MEAATAEKTEKASKASRRELAIEAFASHFRKCPVADKGESPRHPDPIESYVVTAPAIRDGTGGTAVPARKVRVTRCVECGGHEVNDPRGEAYREELGAEDDEEI